MTYFVSHLGIIFMAAAFVAVCAVGWWYLTEKNAALIRQRAEARRRAAEAASQHKDTESDKNE